MRAKFQGEFLDSSVDIGVDRLALRRSWVPGLIALNGVTIQTVFFRRRAGLGIRKEQWCSKGVRENSDSHRLIEWHVLSIMADSFLLSHGLERSMRMCLCPPHAAVRAKFQSEFLDSSVDPGIDRLALLHSWVPGLIDINEFTSQTRVLRCHARGSCASVVPQSCLSQHGPSRECGSARAASLHLVWISVDLGLI